MRREQPRSGVTVAIATLERPERLRRCVTAILAGRVLPAEILIVDQSPDESTWALVSESSRPDGVPIRCVHQERRGLAASRNLAVARASHPVIAFTDDDCVPDAGWLEAILAAFDGAESPDAVTGRVLPLTTTETVLVPVSTRTSGRCVIHRGRSLPWAVGTGGNAAFRREWLACIGGFDERLGTGSPGQSAEDLDLFYRLLRAGAVIRYEPGAVVFHEQQPVDGRIRRTMSYAFGMAALCAMWIRKRDAYACWIVARWCVDRVDTMLRACVKGQSWRIREELATVQGAARGIAYGLTLAAEDRRP